MLTNKKLESVIRDLLLALPYEERKRFIGKLYREHKPRKVEAMVIDEDVLATAILLQTKRQFGC